MISLHTQWAWNAMIVSAFVITFSVLIIHMIHRKIPAARLKGSHDVVGFAYGIIGVLYAVILGFTVVNVQDRYNDAVHISEQEANAIADLYRDAHVFGPPHTEQIQKNLRSYIDLVVKEEWPLMKEGGVADSVVRKIRDLWYIYYSIDPITEKDKIWLAESVSKLNDFTNIRLQRVFNSNESLSPVMWFLLYSGAVITVGFLGFFWVENFKVHIFITIALTALIAFILFLVQALDNVYDGDIALQPDALKNLAVFLDKWY